MSDFYSVWEMQRLRNLPRKLKSEELEGVQ